MYLFTEIGNNQIITQYSHIVNVQTARNIPYTSCSFFFLKKEVCKLYDNLFFLQFIFEYISWLDSILISQDAKKGVLFLDFPPVLQLQLKRFEYDYMRDTMVKVCSG